MDNTELEWLFSLLTFILCWSIFVCFVRLLTFHDSPPQGKSKWRAQTYKLETSSLLKRFLSSSLSISFPPFFGQNRPKRLHDLSREILSYCLIVHHVSRSLWSALCNCLCHMWPCSIIQSLCYGESKVTVLWSPTYSPTASHRHVCQKTTASLRRSQHRDQTLANIAIAWFTLPEAETLCLQGAETDGAVKGKKEWNEMCERI